MLGLGAIKKKMFGSPNDRMIKSVQPLVDKINALEPEFQKLSDEEIIARTIEFRKRHADGESLDALLPEAFANVREASFRALGLRHFDVQMVGGIFLHQGNIAEMKTGEGKTLMATLPVYLNALTGRGVHVVTVNDYLAKRDAEWMSTVYSALGMTTGVVIPGMPEDEKKTAYQCDVTYATNNELGFDYLRDNMKSDLDQVFQRDHHFAIVDEVDSILIDEARTPLIISGPTENKSDLYIKIDSLIPKLAEEHYELDEKSRRATLTDEGNDLVEKELHAAGLLDLEASLYDPESTTLVHHVSQGLLAHTMFKRDKEYIVNDGEVMLIDEFTGRMMQGRRLSNGLHQAIEAKEGVDIQPENVTLASVTFQNYFRLYEKLSGMTGTALTEAAEFEEIYGLGVLEIPTNVPIARLDEDDRIYRTAEEKYTAIIETIKEAHAKGQPMLVGTTSIEKSELLAEMLKKDGVPHNVLNARFHEQEAVIIANAGAPGAVTIATNMAGRGTDIQLGGNPDMVILHEIEAAGEEADPVAIRTRVLEETEEAKQKAIEAGGLFVLATERHESRRIDNQLRGRSGRQGDPGRTIFYLSLEDDLMRIFGHERLDGMLKRLGLKDGEAIVHPWINKALENAQKKVEGRNFDMRKQLLKFDNVMNDQRKTIFAQRREIMEESDLSEIVESMRHQVIEDLVTEHIPEKAYPDQWNTEGLYADIIKTFGMDLPIMAWGDEEGVDDETFMDRICAESDKQIAKKAAQYGPDTMRTIEKQVLLSTIDKNWREHLLRLEHLRGVVNFRGYAQRDPLNEYKTEAFTLFENLLDRLRSEATQQMAHVKIMTGDEQQAMLAQMQSAAQAAEKAKESGAGVILPGGNFADGVDPDKPDTWSHSGRNDDCPCGSGKKYKHCHGRL